MSAVSTAEQFAVACFNIKYRSVELKYLLCACVCVSSRCAPLKLVLISSLPCSVGLLSALCLNSVVYKSTVAGSGLERREERKREQDLNREKESY